jgi:hypothetical protein
MKGKRGWRDDDKKAGERRQEKRVSLEGKAVMEPSGEGWMAMG